MTSTKLHFMKVNKLHFILDSVKTHNFISLRIDKDFFLPTFDIFST